jgi:SAM-dependent methyltransferase
MLKWFGRQQHDGRWFTPAAERNKGPILDVLAKVLPQRGVVLEIASGTGQHAVHFAGALPDLTWQPSDPDPDLRSSIRLRTEDAGLANVNAPLDLDVGRVPWPIAAADALICINMIHVAPWSATHALFDGAGRVVPAGHVVLLYGPFRRFGRPTSESNARFDADLRDQDPTWGVRDLEAVSEAALARGFVLEDIVAMPANNLSLVFRLQG